MVLSTALFDKPAFKNLVSGAVVWAGGLAFVVPRCAPVVGW